MRHKTKLDFQIVSIKLGSKELKALRSKAKKFTKGNLSAWLRHAGLRYVPSKVEKVNPIGNFAVNKKKR